MALTGLTHLKKKHKKVDKKKKKEQREKNRIAMDKRNTRVKEDRANFYKDCAWWGDFSKDNVSVNWNTDKMSGIDTQYSIISNGRTGRTKNEY